MSLPFHYVDLRAFCYATEAEPRVTDALRTLVPDAVEIDRAKGDGHHGDPIVILSARVERAAEMDHVFSRLRESVDFEVIRDELPDRIDENNSLYLQLDKQAAAQGEIRLGQGITVRAKVEAYPAKRETAIENAREALSE
jgi:hypothetical protein